jgi:hypothetical protein
MYMGEVVRRVLVDLMLEGLIFRSLTPLTINNILLLSTSYLRQQAVIIFSDGEGEKLFEKGAFETKFVSGTVRDTVLSYTMKTDFLSQYRFK